MSAAGTVCSTKVPEEIWQWVDNIISEAKDKVLEEEQGDYLLICEGWGGFCVESVWDDTRPYAVNEDAAREYAERQSDTSIAEWTDMHGGVRTLVASGHVPSPMYGVTWALFAMKNTTIKKSMKRC